MNETVLSLLIASLLINAILFLRLKLSEQDRKQTDKVLSGTMLEKDRLREIIRSIRQN